MRVNLTRILKKKYPGVNFFGVLVRNLKNKKQDKKIEEEKHKIIKKLKKEIKNPSKIKLVKDYNSFFNSFNIIYLY